MSRQWHGRELAEWQVKHSPAVPGHPAGEGRLRAAGGEMNPGAPLPTRTIAEFFTDTLARSGKVRGEPRPQIVGRHHVRGL